MFGVHWGFVALNVNNMATLGYDAITIAGLASAFAQAGVVLMSCSKRKNQKIKRSMWPCDYFGNVWNYRACNLWGNFAV